MMLFGCRKFSFWMNRNDRIDYVSGQLTWSFFVMRFDAAYNAKDVKIVSAHKGGHFEKI